MLLVSIPYDKYTECISFHPAINILSALVNKRKLCGCLDTTYLSCTCRTTLKWNRLYLCHRTPNYRRQAYDHGASFNSKAY